MCSSHGAFPVALRERRRCRPASSPMQLSRRGPTLQASLPPSLRRYLAKSAPACRLVCLTCGCSAILMGLCTMDVLRGGISTGLELEIRSRSLIGYYRFLGYANAHSRTCFLPSLFLSNVNRRTMMSNSISYMCDASLGLYHQIPHQHVLE